MYEMRCLDSFASCFATMSRSSREGRSLSVPRSMLMILITVPHLELWMALMSKGCSCWNEEGSQLGLFTFCECVFE